MEPMIVLLPHHKPRAQNIVPIVTHQKETQMRREMRWRKIWRKSNRIPKTEKKIMEHQSVSIPTATVKFPSALLSAALASAVA